MDARPESARAPRARPDTARSLRRRLKRAERTLERAYPVLGAADASEAAERAAEWLIDNPHLLAEAAEQVAEALDPGFIRALPRLGARGRDGGLRILALARRLAGGGDGHVDPDHLLEALNAWSPAPPPTMGELWALPAMLRLTLLEELAAGAARLAGLAPDGGAGAPERVGPQVQSLRVLGNLDWKAFFERASRVHRALGEDPAGVYGGMDFETRDRYRKRVERLARRSGRAEEEVALAAVEAAARAREGTREAHVGYWLVDRGHAGLAVSLGASTVGRARAGQLFARAGPALYVGAVAAVTLGALAAMAAPLAGGGLPRAALALALSLLPASAVAVALVNWAVTQAVAPRVLPKLDFSGGIARGCDTAIIIPAILADQDEVRALADQLELCWHGNADPRARFALLTGLADAPEREMPADAALLALIEELVRGLNARHGDGLRQPFLWLHCDREWNPAQGCWMEWERKRGKITSFNQRVAGEPSRLRVRVGDPAALCGVRFAITLDADTFLPRDAARRLAGTLAHPLNRAVFDERGRVAAGYTVLQPRVELLPTSAQRTPFARVFEGDRGLDLYTRAISDVYQDLFGEGNFAGKGIYDVAAFHRSLAGRVPENALLSHDLFEGLLGRAALVSDVAVYEDYPGHLLGYLRRLHRWTRGDWQLLPWLLPRVPTADGRRTGNPLPPLGRWKVADNLRRSLVAPALVLLLAAGWTALPGPGWWTGAALAVLGLPVALGGATAGRQWARDRFHGKTALRQGGTVPVLLARWVLSAVFLPVHAAVEADAVARTLWRVLATRRRLLEWTTAAHAARELDRGGGAAAVWRRMAAAPAVALALAAAVALLRPAALPVAAPLLMAWLASPALAHRLGRTTEPRREPLPAGDERLLRMVARRTWAFFDRFVGPEDHWLPPDHFQEDPPNGAAHRTSPTNIGLMALSTLAAWDLGYLPLTALAARLDGTFETLEEMERHRGHFLNWYETRQLAPLEPRYVSTVDSGNLAGALLALGTGLDEAAARPLVHPGAPAGMADAVGVLAEAVAEFAGREDAPEAAAVRELERRLRATSPGDWPRALTRLVEVDFPRVESAVLALVERPGGTASPAEIARLRFWLEQAGSQARMLREKLEALAPWLLLPSEPPPELGALAADPAFRAAWSGLRADGDPPPALADISAVYDAVSAALVRVKDALGAAGVDGKGEAGAWIAAFSELLQAGRETSAALAADLVSLRVRAEAMAREMDFAFLYDRSRELFHIGYNVSAGRLDGSYYDLLASEARLASLIAIAHGQVPTRHWLHLGRPLTRVEGEPVLLSWSGSMFEYFLPPLLTLTPRRSLLEMAQHAALARQLRFAARHRVPWGVSESAYGEMDAGQGYQYRAFGVPDLALRREDAERLVIAPYASLLAVSLAPAEVAENVRRFAALGMMGPYGLCEAADFGPPARWARREATVVRSYMAHHQGMVLLALDNHLNGAPMVERFHGVGAIAASGLLLHEQVPGRVRPEPRVPVHPPRVRPARPRAVPPWLVPDSDGRPEVHVLSNGTLSALVTSWGSGGVRVGERAATRWEPDPAREPWGTWLYLRDLESGALWSAAAAPVFTTPDLYEVTFSPHRAEFRRRERGVESRMTVIVAADAPVELRSLSLRNDGKAPRRLRVVSCGEPALDDPARLRRHPAFSKLFVESWFEPDATALLFRRRTASADEETTLLGHAVIHGPGVTLAGWESDRARFIGRGGSPAAPAALTGAGLSGTAGAVLDPVFALACDVLLEPGGTVQLTFLTAAAPSAREVLANLERYRPPGRVGYAMEEAKARAEHELQELAIDPREARAVQLLLTRLVYPFAGEPRPPRAAGPARQQALWGLAVSGDLPVVVLRVPPGPEPRLLLGQLVHAHAALRRAGVRADLVVLDEEPGGYTEPLRDRVAAALAGTGSEHWLNRTGGVFHVPGARLAPGERAALEAAAAASVDAAGPPLAVQLALPAPPPRLPAFVPVASAPPRDEGTAAVERPRDLAFAHELGGFTPDGREYVIHLAPGRNTPAPWINVVANPRFGFIVSETGAGYTWSMNSGEHRLTPWSNDPVLDPPGEALYLRDEETAEVWSPTPGPAPADAAYQVRHGAGYTRFLHASHGLEQEVTLFVPLDDPVKVVRVTLRNRLRRPRRITLTYYAEWVLGADRRTMAPHVATELEAGLGAILAMQRFHEERAGRAAFLASSEPRHGATADRAEFLGTPGSLARPAALARIGLGESYGEGLDPCGALQVHVDLAPGAEKTLHFLLGDGATRGEALDLVRRWRDPAAADAARREAEAFWDDLLGALRIRTPDPAMDLLVNRRLPHQALACRVWGRSALYQSSGAFGFRDQVQDVLAFLATAPWLARAHLLEAARHQFAEGDVLHWWHPPGGAGVRTRCSDDLLWLPFAVAEYVAATGDAAVLDEAVPFLAGPPLAQGEAERYDRWAAGEPATLYEHCVRAIGHGSTRGAHGLPLIGTGDWNDAMDRVGEDGRGESVWLGWFLHAVLLRFAPLCQARGDHARAGAFRARAEALRQAVETAGWDGAWYRRAYFDDGTPLGSAESAEGRIDSLTQSWAVLSGGADPARARAAMEAVWEQLVREDERLVLLLAPPFDRGEPTPGYLRAYPPGVRENGGQYTHAAVWAAWAFAALGDGGRAGALFRLLNPVLRATGAESVARYRVEPYVVAADVYGAPPHTGRGGWTWYTGSAAWLYRLGVEAILGLRRRGGELEIAPCIPSSWPGFEATYRHGTSTYEVTVENPGHVCRGVQELDLDGQALAGVRVPLADDGAVHTVRVRLGAAVAAGVDTTGSAR
ncbi:MAG TPA: glucoamylase family protein [Longimicrobium sp.]|nr:glucoamylase family protein [Longimicrobium sp.]